MPDVYVPKDEFIRRHGEAAYRDRCAEKAAKKRRGRGKRRVREMGDDAPLDPALVRNVENFHPEGCCCWDCLWGGEPERAPRVARWPERIRL